MKLPFGISQYTTWPQPFARDLALYREAGVEHIEICEGKLEAANPEPALESVGEAGFSVSSVQPRFHSPFPNSLRAEPAAPNQRMALLRRSVKLFGRFFPGTTLVVNTGLAPRGDLDSACRIAEREFRKMAKVAADHGVRLALEPLNPVYMNTDTFICSLAHAARLVEAVDHPAFGYALDVWHFWEEPNAAAGIRRCGERVYAVHVSDWRTPRAFGDRLLPGAGEIPLVPLLKTIRKSGYRGIYTMEIFSDLRLRDSLWARPRQSVTEGRKAFAKIWRQVCA